MEFSRFFLDNQQMNLIIWCVLYVLTRHSGHSFVTSMPSEKDISKSTEKILKKTYTTPLIFNQRTEQLNELSVDDVDKKCQLCLIGCPAASQPYVQFNEDVSISKNSIFVKNVISEGHEYARNNIDESSNTCEEPFRPSMVYDEKTKTYDTGYELYYEEGEANMKCEKYDDFIKVTSDIINIKKLPPRPKYNDDSVAIKTKVKDNTRFIFTNGTMWMFYWIPVLSFRINSSKHYIRVVFKNDSSKDHETMDKCDDYDLGQELYQSANNVNFYYSKSDDMFEKVDVPQLREVPEKQAAGSLERTHIMPMMFLHTKAAKLATCTYMNTVPLWSSIVEGQLKLVDRYLYTIFKLWSPYVNIIFGVSGILKLKLQKNVAEEQKKSENILSFLLPNPNKPEKIEIPKLIYRVIEYRMPREDNTLHTYYIVIVVHNHPSKTVTAEDRLCEVPTLGWEAILNDDPEKGLSYACALRKDVNKKIRAFDKTDYPTGFHGTLHLNYVTPYKIRGVKYDDYTDERPNINKKMKELFPDQIIPEI